MRTKRQQEGYLFIDNRGEPVLSPEQIAAQGIDPRTVAGAGSRGRFEAGVVTCSHCHAQIIMNPMRTRDRNYCRKCDHYICDAAACNAGCAPMERMFERAAMAAQRGIQRSIAYLRRSILE